MNMRDMARVMAAGGDTAASSSPDASIGMAPEEMGGEMAGAGGASSIDDLLSQIDAQLEGMPADSAEKIRTHLNAIRDVVAGSEAANTPPEGADQMAASSEEASANPETMNTYPKGT